MPSLLMHLFVYLYTCIVVQHVKMLLTLLVVMCLSTCLSLYPTGLPPMAFWLNKTGRLIVLSCEYPLYQRGAGIKVGGAPFHPMPMFGLGLTLYFETFLFFSVILKRKFRTFLIVVDLEQLRLFVGLSAEWQMVWHTEWHTEWHNKIR